MLEATVKDKVKKKLRELGAYQFWPVQTVMGSAQIDCLFCYRGFFGGIETKRPGAKPNPRQLHVMNQISNAGGLVFLIDGADFGVDQLDSLKDPQTATGPGDPARADSVSWGEKPDA